MKFNLLMFATLALSSPSGSVAELYKPDSVGEDRVLSTRLDVLGWNEQCSISNFIGTCTESGLTCMQYHGNISVPDRCCSAGEVNNGVQGCMRVGMSTSVKGAPSTSVKSTPSTSVKSTPSTSVKGAPSTSVKSSPSGKVSHANTTAITTHTTKTYTITSCHHTVTNCPIGKITTEVLPTTNCPNSSCSNATALKKVPRPTKGSVLGGVSGGYGDSSAKSGNGGGEQGSGSISGCSGAQSPVTAGSSSTGLGSVVLIIAVAMSL